MNNQTFNRTIQIFILCLLFPLLVFNHCWAKVAVVKPSPTVHMVKSSRYGGSSSNDSEPVKRENKHSAIYADGHKVVITGSGTYNYWGEELSKIWIDLDDNGGINTEEETLVEDLSNVYIYGGSLDGNVMKNVNITMKGGNVGAIFGGGYSIDKDAKITGNVNITVSGGSVGLVDGGGDDFDASHSCLVKGNVDILLYNCQYTGQYYINDNTCSHINGFIRVRDFSTHTHYNCKWGNTRAGFFSYMIQTGPGQMSISWRGSGYGEIPSGVNITLNAINIDYYTYVENKGHIQMTSCNDNIVNKSSAWIGNALELPHTPSMEVKGRDANIHSVACSKCGKPVSAKHNFCVVESTSSTLSGAKHKKICTVCSYSVEEACTVRYTKVDGNHHVAKCIDCGHTFGTFDHIAKPGSYKDFSQESHTATCDICDATFKTAHKWSKADESQCTDCGSKNHTHDYQNGTCSICKFEHKNHTAGTSCSICGKGCEHRSKEFQNTQDPSGHYFKCLSCNQIFKDGEHQMTEDQTAGYVCKDARCSFSCSHAETLSHTPSTSTRSYSTPNGTISYEVQHDELSCTRCGSNIECQITDAESNVYYMTTLDAAFHYAIQHKMDNATIKLLKDVTTNHIYADMDNITLNLDVNNCDVRYASTSRYSSISVKRGRLNITNSVFAETGQYANFYNASSVSTVEVLSDASVNLNGVHISVLSLGSTPYTLGDIEVETLILNSTNMPVQISDKVTVYKSISLKGNSIVNLMPKGFIVTEYVDQETWKRLYDHTSKSTLGTGPMMGTNLLRIEPCCDHNVKVAISHSETGHSGTCIYCENFATDIAHSMTQSGHKLDDQYHYKRCEVCGYESDSERHRFDEETGICTDDLCKAQAVVELHLQDGDDKLFFSSFEGAWNAARIGKADTILLVDDVEVTAPLTVRYEAYTDDNDVEKYATPYIIVKGDGMNLNYTGEDTPLSFDGTFDPENALYFCAGLTCSANWSTGTAHARPEIGSVFNAEKTEVSVCTEHSSSYILMTDDNGNPLPFHEGTCSLCKLVYDENHQYGGTDHCLCCNVERVIVANSTIGDGQLLFQYGSLNEAMEHAAQYSAINATPVTIHILQDIDVESDNYVSIQLNTKGADIIIDATDPIDGHEYEINGHKGILFSVYEGKLTILSGIYQSYATAIYLGYDSNGQVQLKGGTYREGSFATINNADGICAGYINYYGIQSAGLRSMIAPGYILTLNRANHEKNEPNLKAEDCVTICSPTTVVSGSGTITKCNHEHLGEIVPTQALTCLVNGHPSYQPCESCGVVAVKEGDETVYKTIEEITSLAHGHQYENEYCTKELTNLDGSTYVCGEPERAITAHRYTIDRSTGEVKESGNEVPFRDFISAWNDMVGHTKVYNEDIKIVTTFTLQTDVDLTDIESSENLYDMCIWHDYIIDLNGHDLNLGNFCLRSNNWSYYPGQDTLIIRDSKKAGKTITGGINTNSVYTYDEDMPKYFGEKSLVLEGVTLKTNFLYDSKDLVLRDGAGISLTPGGQILLGAISMEEGTFLESEGLESIEFNNRVPASADLSKAMHNVQYYAMNDNNDLVEVPGSGTSTFMYDRLTVYLPDGEVCSYWKAVVPEGLVVHTLDGRIEDKESFHLGKCTICSFANYGEHSYANHSCVSCKHKADVYAIADGVTTDYTTLEEAVQAVNGKEATIILAKDKVASFSVSDGSILTIDLNGHELKSDGASSIYLDGASLTIIDSSDSFGKVINSNAGGSCIVVSNKSTNRLTIMGGEFTAADGAVTINAEQVNAEGYPSVAIHGGSYSSIHTGSLESDATSLLAENCYFRSSDNDQLINASQSYVNTYDNKGYNYIENVYAYSSDMKLKQEQDIQIENHASATAEESNALTAEAIGNTGVNSFGQTNLGQVVDLNDILLINDLQNAVSKASLSYLVSSDEDVQAYVEATLMAATIKSVQVIGSEDGEKVQALTNMTFDVKPYACIIVEGKVVSVPLGNDMVQGAVTFRLPVDARYNITYLTVYHTDESGKITELGSYPVLSDAATNGYSDKYIELEGNPFGTYEYSGITEYTLADATAFASEGSIALERLSYVRNFTNTQWEALYIPMSIKPSTGYEIADIYTFGYMIDTNGDGVINEEDEIVLITDRLDMTDATEPNTPYLIRTDEVGEITISSEDNILYGAESYSASCSTTRTQYTFNGTYSEMDLSGALEGFTLQEDGVRRETGKVKPQRWFIDITSKVAGANPEVAQAQSASIRVFTIGEDLDKETALRILKGETVDIWQNGKCYTLDGRRAASKENGIKIINHKKVIEK